MVMHRFRDVQGKWAWKDDLEKPVELPVEKPAKEPPKAAAPEKQKPGIMKRASRILSR
jgi:hypothetical protein